MQDERTVWDHRYGAASYGALAPDPLLPQAFEQYIQPLFPGGGTALDVAGGVGRHAIWLAQRNWLVTMPDISQAGIERARKAAGTWAERIDFQVADLTNFRAGRTRYDLVLVFFYVDRSLFAEWAKVLRPGGLLVYKTFTLEQRNFPAGPSNPRHLLRPNELLQAFPGLQILHYRDTIRERGVAELVAQKHRSRATSSKNAST